MRSKVNGDTKTLTPNMITLYEFEKPRLKSDFLFKGRVPRIPRETLPRAKAFLSTRK